MAHRDSTEFDNDTAILLDAIVDDDGLYYKSRLMLRHIVYSYPLRKVNCSNDRISTQIMKIWKRLRSLKGISPESSR